MQQNNNQDWLRPMPRAPPPTPPNHRPTSALSQSSYFSASCQQPSSIVDLQPLQGQTSFALSLAAQQSGQHDTHNVTPALPIARYAENDRDKEPWNIFRMHSSTVAQGYSPHTPSPHLQGGTRFTGYRPGPMSDGSSAITTGHYFSDSGYRTGSKTYSVHSAEPATFGQSCPDIQESFGSFKPYQKDLQLPVSPAVASDTSPCPKQPLKPPPVVQHRTKSLVCEHCGYEARLRSELKKHILKHDRPYTCTIPDCTRKKGFTTTNDRDRHMKSKHKIFRGSSTAYYRCVSEKCATKARTWPRLDNFRQHLGRMHKGEDHDRLIQESEFIVKLNQPPAPSYHTDYSFDSAPTTSNFNFGSPVPLNSGNFNEQYETSNSMAIGWAKDNNITFSSTNNRYGNNDALQTQFGPLPSMHIPRSVRSDSHSHTSFSLLDGSEQSADHTKRASTNLSQHSPALTSLGHSSSPASKACQWNSNQDLLQPNRSNLEQDLAHIASSVAAQLKQASSSVRIEDAILQAFEAVPGLMVPRIQQGTPPTIQNNSSFGSISEKTSADEDDGADSLATNNQILSADSFESNSSKSSHQNRQTRSFSDKQHCPDCDTVTDRKCDMKKHRRRHTRPFGCTFPDCDKMFGSKNDWKRHENSMHFQTHTWRCNQPRVVDHHTHNGSGQPEPSTCAKLFHRKSIFLKHLERKHNMTDELQRADECKIQHIGINGQRRFWCGFCKSIQGLKGRGVKAWDERFNHIAKHYINDNLHVDSWLMPGGNRTKGQIREDAAKDIAHEEEGESEYSDDDYRTDNSTPKIAHADTGVAPQELMKMDMHQHEQDRSGNSVMALVCCCQCREGPQPPVIHECCVTCSHIFCDGCEWTERT